MNALRLLLLLAVLAVTAGARAKKITPRDSVLLERIYTFRSKYTHGVKGFATNVYTKHLYQTHRRNVTLWAIPSTYAIAKGERSFVSEQYSRLYFRSVSDFDHRRQVYYTTIPHSSRTLPTLTEFITPNLYEVTMYGDHILSPFCKENRMYYRYWSAYIGHGKMRLYFRPRVVSNTQLVTGKAIVDHATGQIEQLEMEGEFDMIRFRTLTMQGESGSRALLPRLCRTSIEFRFAGNHVTSDFTTLYDCPITLPDTLDIEGDRQLIDSIRPVSLSEEEMKVYESFNQREGITDDAAADSLAADSLVADKSYEHLMTHTLDPYTELDTITAEPERRSRDWVKYIGWDLIGSNVIHGLGKSTKKGYVRLSPILSPQYISYSSSKGVSYKMRLRGEYRFSPSTILSMSPYIGYRWKDHEFYFEVPLWLQYSPKHKASWFFNVSKNNQIGNSVVLDDLVQKTGMPIEELSDKQWDYFGDNMLHLSHSMYVVPQLSLSVGLTYHIRKAKHAGRLSELGLTNKYLSLAPSVSVGWRPWPKAPLLTVDYERGIKSKHLNIDYERWEADLSLKHYMSHLQTLNMRIGGGVYTRRTGSYFMDFANFRDNNLPEGWDDDWSGEFQLLDSRLYNESRYYLRGNLSYETPLICGYLMPILGRYVERERFYCNTLNIEHTRLYSEVGYGFTTRFLSIGVFASFRDFKYQEMTTKFTFELFRRW